MSAATHPVALLTEPDVAEGGHRVGRDPRRISRETWRAAGIRPTSTIAAVRAKCVDCCAGSKAEVRRCMSLTCPLWPHRMGVNPFHGNRLHSAGPPSGNAGKSPVSEECGARGVEPTERCDAKGGPCDE